MSVHLEVIWLPRWRQNLRIHIWWRLYLIRKTWMKNRSCYETCWVNLLRVFRYTDKRLGTAPMVSLLTIMWGWKTIIPHCWYFPEGHITIGVGRKGMQPEGYEWWLLYSVELISPCFTLLYCLTFAYEIIILRS